MHKLAWTDCICKMPHSMPDCTHGLPDGTCNARLPRPEKALAEKALPEKALPENTTARESTENIVRESSAKCFTARESDCQRKPLPEKAARESKLSMQGNTEIESLPGETAIHKPA